jgi:hypothetical protein
MVSKIDLEQLRLEIQNMQRWQPIYKILKQELSVKGFWKNKARGNPKKAYQFGWGKHKTNV